MTMYLCQEGLLWFLGFAMLAVFVLVVKIFQNYQLRVRARCAERRLEGYRAALDDADVDLDVQGD